MDSPSPLGDCKDARAIGERALHCLSQQYWEMGIPLYNKLPCVSIRQGLLKSGVIRLWAQLDKCRLNDLNDIDAKRLGRGKYPVRHGRLSSLWRMRRSLC